MKINRSVGSVLEFQQNEPQNQPRSQGLSSDPGVKMRDPGNEVAPKSAKNCDAGE